jgi:type VI secretion system protein ImpK
MILGGARRAPAQPRGRLVDLCGEWLTLIAMLRQASELPDAAALRARALELRARLDQDARARGVEEDDIREAVFALVAFLDETVLATPGPAREVWITRPLQLELFGEALAGEKFFTRLDELRRERERRIEALEVYYACLAFGFGGKYRLGGSEKLRALLVEVERDVATRRGAAHGPLGPHALPRDELANAVRVELPVWLSLAIFAGGVVLVLVVLALIANLHADHAAATIKTYLNK